MFYFSAGKADCCTWYYASRNSVPYYEKSKKTEDQELALNLCLPQNFVLESITMHDVRSNARKTLKLIDRSILMHTHSND